MPIIKQKEIYDPSKGNPVEQLTKDLNLLVDVEKVLIKQNKELAKSLQLIKKSGDGKEAKELTTQTDRLTKSTLKLKEVKTASIRVNEQLNKARTRLIESQTKEAKELAKVNAQLAKNRKELRESAKEAIKLDNAYDELVRSTNRAQKNFKTLAAQFGVNSKQAKAARIEFDKLDAQLRQINTASKDGRRDVGRYGTALKGVGTQLLGATGIVGGVDLAIQGFQKFAETSREINDLTKRIGTNFGITGNEAKQLAARVNGLADTFGEDYNEVLIAANTVSKELGISGAEATALIEEGFLKGSNNSGEFLDILKEYPAQFASVGIDAETAFAIINQQVREGIYSDKGVDAIKEAGLRLRENTKAVQEALAPLDESIKKQIEQEIAAGNSFKAIQLVSEALKDTSLSAEETQTIIADVFGGPGEDAGLRYLQTLSDIETSLEGVAIQASESEQASLALSQSWNRFVAGVSDSDGIFGKVFAGLKNFLAGAINSLSTLIELVSGGDKAVDGIARAIANLKKSIQEQTSATNESSEANNKNTTSVVKLTAAQKKQIESEKALNAERERRKKLLADLGTLEAIETRTTDTQIQQTELAPVAGGFFRPEAVDEAKVLTKEINENIEAENKARRQRELEAEAEQAAAIKDIKDFFIAESTQFASDLFAQSQDDELARITSDNEAKKVLLEDQLEKGVISQADFNRKIEELNKKQRIAEGKAEKRKALFDIAINTAVAIAKALPNLILAGVVAAQGAIQAALVAAKPIPGFAEGVIGFKGEGTRTSDSNLAKISNGESVITAQGTDNAPITLDAINRGLLTDRDISKGMTRAQTDGLKASLLMQGNKINSQILTAILNGGFSSENKDFYIIHRNDGSVTKIPKS
jgi:hypothetical protein